MVVEHTPYSWQLKFWERWEATRQPRILVSAPTGSGKTLAAQHVFSQYPRVLITGPGLSLEPWKREVSDLVQIETGPRAGISKPAKARLEAALAARHIFMTPAVLQKWADKLPPVPRQLLVPDEAHMYDDPNTRRSKWLCTFLRNNLRTDCLALTATFIRKEVRDVWSLSSMLAPWEFPDQWQSGEYDTPRHITYSFLSKYCQRDSEMGYFFGARPEKLPELKERLAKHFVEFVDPAEVLSTAPKAQPRLSDASRDELIEDLKTNPAESKCLLFEHIEVAMAYAAQLGWPCYTSENSTTTQRVAAIDMLRNNYATRSGNTNFVGTWKCFQEAVSLAWVEHTLLFEPPTTPGQIEQLMGRFERPEPSQRVPAIIVIEASPNAMKRLGVLNERSNQALEIQGISQKAAGLLEAVRAQSVKPITLALAADYDPDLDYAIRFIDGEFDDDQSGDLA